MSRRRRLALGTVVIGVANVLKMGLQLLTLPLLARFLGPSEYGLFGLAMPAVSFMIMLADGGLSTSLAREPETSQDVWSTAFWFLIGSGVVLAAILILLSFVLAAVADQPRLPAIMSALSLCLILIVVAVPSGARLTRQGRLGVWNIGDMVGSILGAVVALLLAARGAGTWSLVAQALLVWICKTSASVAAAPYLPKFRFSMRALVPHLAVGGSVVGGRLADIGGRSAEAALLGHTAGTGFLGAFSFANHAPRALCDAAGGALWTSLFAHSVITGPAPRSLTAYYAVTRAFGLAMFPLAALITVQAAPIVRHLLGPEWASAAFMIQVLLPMTALNSVGSLMGPLFYASGEGRVPFLIAVESACFRLIVVAAWPWIGTTSMIVGLGIAYLYVSCRCIFAMARFPSFSITTFLSNLRGPAVASSLAGLLCWALPVPMSPLVAPQSIEDVAIHVGIGLIAYTALLCLLDFHRIVRDLSAVRHLLRPSPAN